MGWECGSWRVIRVRWYQVAILLRGRVGVGAGEVLNEPVRGTSPLRGGWPEVLPQGVLLGAPRAVGGHLPAVTLQASLHQWWEYKLQVVVVLPASVLGVLVCLVQGVSQGRV